jgi:hypothetical protein
MTYEELTAKIGSLHKDAGEIVTRNANSDEWPSDDRVKFDQLHAEIRKLGDTKSRIDLQKKVEEELSQSTRQTDPNEIRRQPNQTENRNTADPELADGAMRAWMLMRLGGSAASSIRPEWRSAAQKMGVDLNSPEYPFKLPAMTPRSTRP